MPLVDTTVGSTVTERRGALQRMLSGLGRILAPPIGSSQGLHVDPAEEAEPDPKLWSKLRRGSWFSEEMTLFRACLRYDGMDIRNAILDDLSRYYGLSSDETLRRCRHWEEWSVDEWRAADRSTREGLREFYNSVQSWSFDLLWYAYLQASGFGFPASVAAARFARTNCSGKSHLDFGSGVGVTSQLFSRIGFDTTAADVSRSLLDFAQWRLDRRGDRVAFFDLNTGTLPDERHDVVTSIDTLTHVPDFDATVRDLHRTIRPGGWLLTNFDVRAKGTDGSAWHLYDDAFDLELRLRRVGFVQRGKLDGMLLCYQRVDPRSVVHRVRTFRDRVTLEPPVGHVIAACNRVRWPTPDRVRRYVRRAAGERRKPASAP